MRFLHIVYKFYLRHCHVGLEHGTIRQNIIFASERGFDEDRYTAVINSCSLKRDLEILTAGDQTGKCNG